MLDGVGDVDALAIDARLLERLIEQPARRTDERLSLDVLAVTRLLPDKHDRCMLGTLSKHGLRARLVEIAGPAACRGIAQPGQCRRLRYEFLRRGRRPNPARLQPEAGLLHLRRRSRRG